MESKISESSSSTNPSPIQEKRIVVICATFIMALAIYYAYQWVMFNKPPLLDGDGFMRLVRIMDLYTTHDWYNCVIARDNYPYGDYVAWTRPLDIMMMILTYPIHWISSMSFKDSLFWVNFFWGPLLLIITLWIMVWAIRPLKLSSKANALVVLCFSLSNLIIIGYGPGRGDHHGLLITWYVTIIGLGLRLSSNFNHPHYAQLLGLCVGFGLWISPETMAGIVCVYLSFVMYWMNTRNSMDGLNVIHYSIPHALLMMVVGMISEHPLHSLLVVEHDRLSIVHCVLLTFGWVVNYFIRMIKPYSKRDKMTWCIMGGIFILTMMEIVFPGFYKGPMASVDPHIKSIWFDQVQEIKPLYRFSIASCIMMSVITLFIMRFLKKTKDHLTIKNFFLINVIGFFILTMLASRWEYYWAAIVPICVGFIYNIHARGNGRIPFFAIIIALIGLKPIMNNVLTYFSINDYFKKDDIHLPNHHACEYRLKQWVSNSNDLKILGDDPRTVLFIYPMMYLSSPLLWNTNHRTVGSPYTHNVHGIYDNYAFFNSNNWDQSMKIIKQRHISAIVMCPIKNNKNYTVLNDLMNGKVPSHFKKIDLGEGAFIYSIEKENRLDRIFNSLNKTHHFEK
jgi:hypothetical protein